jgi:hypothetical protein
MKSMRPTAGYLLLGHGRNEDSLEEVVEKKLALYKHKWFLSCEQDGRR